VVVIEDVIEVEVLFAGIAGWGIGFPKQVVVAETD
jgi:hypothetical protein